MKWMRIDILGVVGTLLMVLGLGAASAHEGHRKASAVTLEAPEAEPAPQLAEPTGEVSTATADSTPTHAPHPHANSPLDPDPESVSVLDWLGRLHPMAIHFPIALFLAAFMAEILYIATRRELFRHALRFCLWGGAMSAAIAAPLGWMFAASGATEEGWILETHRWAGTTAALLGVAVLWTVERAEHAGESRILLRVLLALQALLIGSVGFLGGSLLYGIDHLWRGF